MWSEHGEHPVARSRNNATVEQGTQDQKVEELGEIDPPVDKSLNNVARTVCFSVFFQKNFPFF
jgi:hypothetical protein